MKVSANGQRPKEASVLHCFHRKVIVFDFVASVFFVFLQDVVTGFSGLPRRECCYWFASFVFVVLNGYGYSTGRRWYWHSFFRTRSRSLRTLKRPLTSLKQRRDGNAAPRPLFPSTVVDTASDDGVRSDSKFFVNNVFYPTWGLMCLLICVPLGHRRGPLWRSVRRRWRIRDVQIRLVSSRYEVAWKMSKGSCAATSTLEGSRGNGH